MTAGAIAILLGGSVPQVALAGIAVYEPDRYYATTGKVRWFAGGEGALYASDLRRQVAAIDAG